MTRNEIVRRVRYIARVLDALLATNEPDSPLRTEAEKRTRLRYFTDRGTRAALVRLPLARVYALRDEMTSLEAQL